MAAPCRPGTTSFRTRRCRVANVTSCRGVHTRRASTEVRGTASGRLTSQPERSPLNHTEMNGRRATIATRRETLPATKSRKAGPHARAAESCKRDAEHTWYHIPHQGVLHYCSPVWEGISYGTWEFARFKKDFQEHNGSPEIIPVRVCAGVRWRFFCGTRLQHNRYRMSAKMCTRFLTDG